MVPLSLRRAVAAAAVALLASPAAAVSVDVFASIAVDLTDTVSAFRTDTDDFVDPSEAVSVEFGPGNAPTFGGFQGVDATASLDEVGSEVAVSESTVTVTNLLDAELEILFDFDGFWEIELGVEAPGEVAIGAIDIGVLLDGEVLGGDVDEFRLAASDCDSLPCDDSLSDFPATTSSFLISPLATETLALRAEATAIAAIPLPAALGPLALVLGGLAWTGRRRARG